MTGHHGRRSRRRFDVSGVVQGVGFRPFVYAAAAELELTGTVHNDVAGVVIDVEGLPERLIDFARRLTDAHPPLAVVEAVVMTDLEPRGGTGFSIGASSASGGHRTFASPDVATCDDCVAELRDPTNRRFRHPFITCTNCGPRFTIITDLPYDRGSTTMVDFPMCEACQHEYEDPADRRFHAQPIACHDCGPTLRLVSAGAADELGEQALSRARTLLQEGGIVAVKGLGGYHLACDAGNETAVAELRRRKARGGKPFAIMVRDLRHLRRIAEVSDDEEAILTGGRRPILLLRSRSHPSIAASVAPHNPDLGVLLPYTATHELLMGRDGHGTQVLVMTSGNVSGEPIVTDDAQAMTRLAGLADAWLMHNRRITVPCDDSVARFTAGIELPIRRSRGYAPLPIALPFEVEPILAVGADLKNACGVAQGRYAWISQHLGDMDDLATIEALTASAAHLEMLTGVEPAQLVADLHPAYRSPAWAKTQAAGRPIVRAQHHHAHIASVMGEHGVPPEQRVIGIAFDGTGYGTDGAVWGGEVMIADYKGFQRSAHLAYVPLAGGDASVLRPYRMALAHLHNAGVPWSADLPSLAACPDNERAILRHQLSSGFGCVPTSSMGRLFDAVASLAGVRHEVEYEAQAAIELEGLARGVDPEGGYRFALVPGDHQDAPTTADPTPVVGAIVSDVRAGVPAPVIAARFHDAVTALIVTLARQSRAETGLSTVVLGGGVFQNALLLPSTVAALREDAFDVLHPHLLPPNDGGISLGQILIGAAG
ncbi:carbamoyltransferase HypF [Aeromicrobium sp.]|uniref:carbamoyltransferase HypF n=1 Tax=Aeromicrobium sp. TaxID=1871063 RepID=UPI0019C07F3C|nr:carbamoyltransferase HypF [Aeromicrobium sp.]MBC7633816.1 carbamoyltransferase HypF [Aeromicrobium sp.]